MINKQIKLLRKELNLSQEQLSKDLNISREALAKYENGTRTPSIDLIIEISKYFKVSTDYLLGITNVRRSLGRDKIFDSYINDCILVYDRLRNNLNSKN
ncbi:helix-turn-helix transcriptional regulator [Clostridium sp.]|uniref:helix-turn-helix domain-containing protein n=1 Tax=Clostridium sp. TaxID=1506 RepID=UPI00290B220C|nr:helix-turn-helix transcriptional regulator [Clostridium sp.]MDU3526393.1 helix-turn-helix transcriptional regulator [Clostridium sp.]